MPKPGGSKVSRPNSGPQLGGAAADSVLQAARGEFETVFSPDKKCPQHTIVYFSQSSA